MYLHSPFSVTLTLEFILAQADFLIFLKAQSTIFVFFFFGMREVNMLGIYKNNWGGEKA